MYPRTLNELLVDPSDAYLAAFLAQIDEFIAHEVRHGRWSAFGLGDQYRAFLAQVREAPPTESRAYRVLAILVYLICVPGCFTQREQMHPKDRAFLEQLHAQLSQWLNGRDRDGQPFDPERTERLRDQHTVAFVLDQLDDYRYFHRFPPPAQHA